MKKTVNTLTLIVAAALFSAPAIALDGAALYSSKTCVACHGPDGKKTIVADVSSCCWSE